MKNNIYDFEATLLNGKTIKMDEFKGTTMIIVNTASKCGFTPQYEGLEKLYQSYKDKGLVILAFPCNQFGKQETGNAEEIQEFCQINYGVSFLIFDKIDVNGKHAHPLFQYLKEALPGTFGNAIKWNFTKFLINKNGVPLKRFAPISKPEKIEPFLREMTEL